MPSIIYKAAPVSSSLKPTLTIESGDYDGVLIAQAVGRVTDSGDVTVELSATNVTDAQGGKGATNSKGYSQLVSTLFVAKIAANTSSTITANFSKGGDWRHMTAVIIPLTGVVDGN